MRFVSNEYEVDKIAIGKKTPAKTSKYEYKQHVKNCEIARYPPICGFTEIGLNVGP
jgi:hypothetical protein